MVLVLKSRQLLELHLQKAQLKQLVLDTLEQIHLSAHVDQDHFLVGFPKEAVP